MNGSFVGSLGKLQDLDGCVNVENFGESFRGRGGMLVVYWPPLPPKIDTGAAETLTAASVISPENFTEESFVDLVHPGRSPCDLGNELGFSG